MSKQDKKLDIEYQEWIEQKKRIHGIELNNLSISEIIKIYGDSLSEKDYQMLLKHKS